MGRAFSEEEKEKIKEDVMETALELFHNNGAKSLSISVLTKRVGIAQGSFYNFWKDKDSLIIDLAAYRSGQKLKALESVFSSSLDDPVGFLTDVIYKYSLDLMIKIKTQPIYEEAFKILKVKKADEINQIESLYGEFLKKLVAYWRENKAIKYADEKGLANAFIGSFLFCSEHHLFDEKYFEDILKTYISGIVKKYIKL
ncbi:TetR/AcrR family transcriptional regulator [Lachnoanaerobaculum gingivalis]|jgi:transcriptional regulator, tetR family|uniref:TetR/AcrR family transcriptional regulator n=1 Tax=Lachnoanaerobaculum gingivalis TaxID=2490855 RepID=A0A3P3QUC5_9FIRM|nr:TetR/AcrR family transcriptional regulator [Lachnoanaerobaculum gingivalis]RRJ24348.1 TetR/AcrR family transcriptional regulator [Lachnoanaerobaculum gingivalis]